MNHSTILVIIFLMYSCNFSKNEKANESNILTDSMTSISPQNLGLKSDTGYGLNILYFKKLSDSIVSIIINKANSFQLSTDTIKLSSLNFYENIAEDYLNNKSKLLVKHSFKIAEPNSLLTLILYESRFSSKASLDSVFSYFVFLANEDKQLPGISYENDYVIRQDKYLLWLNTNCAYAFDNHMKFANAIKASLINSNIEDSIVCRCGAVNCN